MEWEDMKFISKLSIALVLALLIAACGGGDDSSSEADKEFVDAVLAELDEDPPPDSFDIDTRCMAEEIVSSLGGAKNIEEKYGFTAADVAGGSDIEDLNLDESTALSMTDNIWTCGDFPALMLTGLAGEGIEGDDAKCLLDIIGEDPIKKLIASGFMGDAGAALEDEASEALFTTGIQAVAECGITP